MNPSEPLVLSVEIASADLEIAYSRDGEVSISALATSPSGSSLDQQFFTKGLTIEQGGNRVTLHGAPDAPDSGISVRFRIDAPYRTEVISHLIHGKQNITGMLGPVHATSGKGDIKVSYVSQGVFVRVEAGDVDLQVIGERGEARIGTGNITCTRALQGVTAETGDGDITLAVVGPSTAMVNKGTGRIDIGGARGSLNASTAGGDIHVKASPHDEWKLSSTSGTIRLELPPLAKLDLDASTGTGSLQIDRNDIETQTSDARNLRELMNGGGKRVEVHTDSGRIVIR